MSIAGNQGYAGIRDPPELPERLAMAEQWMPAGVFDYQRLSGTGNGRAERERERRRTTRCPGLGEARGGLKELALVCDQGNQRRRGSQQPGSHPGEPVESFFRGGIEQGRLAERRQAVGAEE